MITFLLFLCFLLETVSSLSVSPQTRLMMASSSTNDESLPFALNLKVTVLPEKRDEWLKQIKADQVSSREEEGNIQFSLSEDIESPNTFYLHEQYVNEAAFVAHTQSPHFKRYDDFVKAESPCVGEPEIFFFCLSGEGEDFSKSKRNVHKTAFCVTVNLYPKEEVRKEFLRVIENNKKGTDETEPLALQYSFGESTSVPNVFHFHEQYSGGDDGKEGFDAHAASAHFSDWESFVGTDPFAKPPEVFFSRVIEE